MPRAFRLIGLLLVLLLALPAMQARACAQSPMADCHQQEHAASAAMSHHAGQTDGDHRAPAPPPTHDCIGCVAPIDIAAYGPAAPLNLVNDRYPAHGASYGFAGMGHPPEPPPPRRTVSMFS